MATHSSQVRLSRRSFLQMSAGTGALLALAACAVPTAPATTDTDEAGAMTASGPVDLTFWTFVAAHNDYYQAQVEKFNEENPDAQITLETSVFPTNEMHDKLLIALQSGTGAPDIVDVNISFFGTFLRGNIQFLDLTDLVDRHRDNLIAARLAPYQFQGKQYGIPTHLGSYLMYYNKDLFDQAGVDFESIRTWSDYMDLGADMTIDSDGDGTPDQWMTAIQSVVPRSIFGLMKQNGGGVYDADGNFILDSEANVEATQMAADMVHDLKISTIPTNGDFHDPGFYEVMNAGDTVSSLWYPQWYMIRFTEFMPDLEGKIICRSLPVFEEGGFVSTMGGGTGTAITEQIDEASLPSALDLLEYAKLTYDANIRIWTEFGFDPFRSDVYDDPILQEPLPYFGNESVMSVIQQNLTNLGPEYLGPRYPETLQMMGEVIAYEIIEQGTDPAQVLTDAADQIRALDA